jgi:hypothetical protein
VYWYGIGEFADIERCVAHCRERPATLEDPVGADAETPAEVA